MRIDVARLSGTTGISRASWARSRSARLRTETPSAARARGSASDTASGIQASGCPPAGSGGRTNTPGPRGDAASVRTRAKANMESPRGRWSDGQVDTRGRPHPGVGGELLAEVKAQAAVQTIRPVVVERHREAGRGQALPAERLEGDAHEDL